MHNRELTETELAEIARLRRKNYSNREISRLMGISLYRATIIGKRCEELEALRKENASLKNEAIETVCSIASHLEDYPPEVGALVKFYLRSRSGNFF